MKLIIILFCLVSINAWADDPRYCGPPARDANGTIIRSSAVLREFKKLHPCPNPDETRCPGWQIDHVIPLVCGGCDTIMNLQWMPVEIKTCALSTGVPCKDRWEQRVYCQ